MKHLIKIFALLAVIAFSQDANAASATHTIAQNWGQILAGGTNYVGTNLYSRGITVSQLILSQPTGSAQNNIAFFDAPNVNVLYRYSVTNSITFTTNLAVSFVTPAGITMTNILAGVYTTPNQATTLDVNRPKWLFSTLLTNGVATYTFDPPIHLGGGLTVTNSQPINVVITYEPNF